MEEDMLDSLAHAQFVRQTSALAMKEIIDDKKAFIAGMMKSSPKGIKKRLGQIGQTGV